MVKGTLTCDEAKLIQGADNHSVKNVKATSVATENTQEHKAANKLILEIMG